MFITIWFLGIWKNLYLTMSLDGYNSGSTTGEQWLNPAVNFHRTPFSGRNNEYYGQDGYHAGWFAQAVVRGIQSKGVGSHLKHMFLNDQETNRNQGDLMAWVSEQAIREIYVKPFQMGIQEGEAEGAMSAFARIGSVPTPVNYNMCELLVRTEWGANDFFFHPDMYSPQSNVASEDLMLRTGHNHAPGVVAHPKHFIFNDEEANRNGICIWMNEQAAREIYLLPWEYALRPDMGGGHALMTSFNRAGCLWTSASDNLMENILRKEWAFDGYTLTDMAGSNGKLFMVYDDGFMNGTDLFLDKGTTSGLTADMRNSNTFNTKLRESMKRLLFVIANYSAALDGYSNLTRLQPVTPWWKALIVSFIVIFAVLAIACIALFVMSIVFDKKGLLASSDAAQASSDGGDAEPDGDAARDEATEAETPAEE